MNLLLQCCTLTCVRCTLNCISIIASPPYTLLPLSKFTPSPPFRLIYEIYHCK